VQCKQLFGYSSRLLLLSGGWLTAKSLLHGKYKWTEEAPPMVVAPPSVYEDKMRSMCCKAVRHTIMILERSNV
jgi:hypothetical protein